MSVFHEGEIEVQNLTGERNRAAALSRMIVDHLRPMTWSFIESQEYCAAAWRAPDGELWASFITGPKGFLAVEQDGATLTLALAGHNRETFPNLVHGDGIGILMIDLKTRKRLRVNGRVSAFDAGELRVSVQEAFPNCPKYIQVRELQRSDEKLVDQPPTSAGTQISDEIREWVATADTFFVSSASQDGRLDVSHRGGKPGFVRFLGDWIRVPDYPGNSMFGTLGNFAVTPFAGLVFVDFENARQLHLTGDVRLDLAGGETMGETGGTGRWWEFRPRKWVIAPLGTPASWRLIEASPYNP